MLARVPVPWGSEPKAQVVSGLTVSSWVVPDAQPRKRRYFEDLFRADLEISLLIRNPPVPLALKALLLADEELPPDLRWAVTRGVIRAYAPAEYKPQLTALPEPTPMDLDLRAPEWGVIEERKAEPPARARPQISTRPSRREIAAPIKKTAPISAPISAPIKYRDLPEAPRVAAIRPVMPASLVRESTRWQEMPPALAKWAVDRGLTRAEPPRPARPIISAVPSRKQLALAALNAGDWVRVSDLDIFPPRLCRWLEECHVEFIRCFGWGKAQGGAGAVTPINGYVTEDGTVFYCAEDGSTFYVQEQ
jgi:hypothetical protein